MPTCRHAAKVAETTRMTHLRHNSPRAATATALTDVELIPIGEKQFLFLVDETPYFALTVMPIMADRLRKQNRSGG